MREKLLILVDLLEKRDYRDQKMIDSIGYNVSIGARMQERADILVEIRRLIAETE